MTWLLVKTLLSLVAVLGLMVALAWLAKRYLIDGRMRTSHAVDIEVLGQKMIQPKRHIMVIKVLNKVLVVGSSESGMSTLTEIDEDEAMRQISVTRRQNEARFEGLFRRSERIEPAPHTFADYLAQNLGISKLKLNRRKGGAKPMGRSAEE